MKEYLKQHSIVYRQPATYPEDGAAIGNRVLAAMVYSDKGNYSAILAKDDCWDNRTKPYEAARHGFTHEKFLELIKDGNDRFFEMLKTYPDSGDVRDKSVPYPYEGNPVHAWSPYPSPKVAAWFSLETSAFKFREQRLSLYDATVTTSYDGLKIKSVIPAGCGQNIFVADIETDQPRVLTAKIKRPKDPGMDTAPEFAIVNGTPVFTYPFPDGYSYSVAMRGEGCVVKYSIVDTEIRAELQIKKNARLMVSVGSVSEGSDTVRAAMFAPDAMEDCRDKNEAYWEGFWEKSHIRMTDKYLENLWYFALYQAAISFSPDYSGGFFGSFFLYEPVAFNSDMHEVNEPFKFYGVQAANHPELADGYVQSYYSMIPRVRENTKKYYGFDGLRFPHACGYAGEEKETWTDNIIFQYMQSASGLISHLAWDQFLFTRDTVDLKNRIYPIISGSADFYANYLQMGGDGYYHIYPTFSPEQHFSIFCRDALIDLALAKLTFKAAILSSEILGVDEDKRMRWKEKLDKIAPYPRSEKGIIEFVGDQSDYVFGHDSTMYCVHPAAEYEETQEYLDLLDMTLRRMGIDESASFAKAHLVVDAAWLGQGDKAYDILYDLAICPHWKPNGFASCGDVYEGEGHTTNLKYYPDDWKSTPGDVLNKRECFTVVNPNARDTIEVDTTQGLLMGINEMMLQSQKGLIRVFYGLPSHQDASFENLLARGGVVVSSTRKDGVIPFIRLHALCDTKIVLDIPWKNAAFTVNGEKVPAADTMSFEMKKDEVIIIVREGCEYQPERWDFKGEAEPRCVRRVLKQMGAKGYRNWPLTHGMLKNADSADIWLGKPEANAR